MPKNADADLDRLMHNYETVQKSINACVRKSCPTAAKNYKQLLNDHVLKGQQIAQDYAADRIVMNEMMRRSEQLKLDLNNSQQMKERVQCSINNCLVQARQLVELYGDVLAYECKRQSKQSLQYAQSIKDACKKLEQAKKVLAKKSLTVNDTITLKTLLGW
jgi:hypothetical protein